METLIGFSVGLIWTFVVAAVFYRLGALVGTPVAGCDGECEQCYGSGYEDGYDDATGAPYVDAGEVAL